MGWFEGWPSLYNVLVTWERFPGFVRIATEKGRKIKPELKLGICGDHGGEPSSIAFAHETGLSYVSCSPYQVSLARLAAAQAAISSQAVERDR